MTTQCWEYLKQGHLGAFCNEDAVCRKCGRCAGHCRCASAASDGGCGEVRTAAYSLTTSGNPSETSTPDLARDTERMFAKMDSADKATFNELVRIAREGATRGAPPAPGREAIIAAMKSAPKCCAYRDDPSRCPLSCTHPLNFDNMADAVLALLRVDGEGRRAPRGKDEERA